MYVCCPGVLRNFKPTSCASEDDVEPSTSTCTSVPPAIADTHSRTTASDTSAPLRTTTPPDRIANMSEAYERERQNTDSLSALQAKVSQLRSVTIDIYDNARDQHVIDSTSDTFSTMGSSLKGSARRLGVMASQGNKVAVLKLAGIIVGVVVLLYWLASFFW
ncbi:hypothetical protein B0A55_03025 [Friedmanniomyces simplex]|uniref:t-SNARE coiled-coil homology domain-containing protein n=1 Tax=Friedmanniomyces simplex TaxID=329884 RepID=A0A4U0XRL1_9PEZI|nr:hypothetical protein B0A55_03025 [Friedmanniomyces simplex]